MKPLSIVLAIVALVSTECQAQYPSGAYNFHHRGQTYRSVPNEYGVRMVYNSSGQVVAWAPPDTSPNIATTLPDYDGGFTTTDSYGNVTQTVRNRAGGYYHSTTNVYGNAPIPTIVTPPYSSSTTRNSIYSGGANSPHSRGSGSIYSRGSNSINSGGSSIYRGGSSYSGGSIYGR